MDRPHLAFPVQFGPAGYQTVEQDTEEGIASCVATILSWPIGTHPSNPNFGIAEQAFLQGGAGLGEIRQAILQSEPRAAQLAIIQDDALLAQLVARVTVGFTVREPGQ